MSDLKNSKMCLQLSCPETGVQQPPHKPLSATPVRLLQLGEFLTVLIMKNSLISFSKHSIATENITLKKILETAPQSRLHKYK